jgi:hypothetical protein
MAEIRPQPQSPALGALARMLGAARDAAGRVRIDSQLLGQTSLADLLSLPGAAGLAEDVSYFGPAAMLRPGSGRTLQTFKLDPRVLDAADVALNVSPLGALAAKGAARAARPVARAAGEAVNRAMLTGEGPLATALAPVAPRQLIVYHGTPHRFERFDASKIGTGEGAQAYGHGLYFAESPEVAKSYQKLDPTVEPPPLRTFRGQELDPGSPEYHAARLVDEMSLAQARKQVAEWIKNADPRMTREAEGWQQTLDLLNQARSKTDFKRLKNQGSLYTVDLPDEAIARMLDWDKPLSEQPPQVKKAVAVRFDELRSLGASLPADPSGEWLHRSFHPQAGEEGFGQSLAAERLRAMGIPGIRYLDQGSRGNGSIFKQFKDKEEAESFAADVKARGGEGIVQPRPNGWVVVGEPPRTSNFVVFPGAEDMLTILERKAKGGPVRRYAEGGAVNAAQYDPADIARRAASLMEEIDAA